MIKTVSKPTDKTMFGDYNNFVEWVLFGISVVGSAYSAYTEYFGFLADSLAQLYPIGYPLLGIAFIESSRWIIPLFFLTIFRIIKNPADWAKRILPLLILGFLSFAMTWVSNEKSKAGNEYKVEMDNQAPTIQSVDSSEYLLLCEVCYDKWHSDSLSAGVKVAKKLGKGIEKANEQKFEANQRISQIKHNKEGWAVNTVSLMENKREVALGEISSIKEDIKNATLDSIKIAKAEYLACLKQAKTTLLFEKSEIESDYKKSVKKTDKEIEKQILVNNWIIYIGIGSIWVYAFFSSWLQHVSGKEVTYNLDETDGKIGFTQKFSILLKATIMNWSDNFLNFFWKDMSVSLKDGEIKITKESDAQKRIEAEQKRIEAEQKRLADEAALAQQKAELAALKQAAELQAAQLEAETQKVKDAARIAAIEAEAERERLEAATLAEQKRLKEIAAENLRIEKENLRKQETERLQKQETERLKREQQEIERLQKQETERKQEIETKKALAEKAALLAAQKLENDELEQQETIKLQQAKETINKKSATGKNLETLEATQFVDDLFEKFTINGVLDLHKDLKGAINNYKTRWEAAEKRLKEDLSEGRRLQALKTRDNNKEKFEYAVEKAADMGVKITYKNGILEMNPIK